jgi:hypothetical protein
MVNQVRVERETRVEACPSLKVASRNSSRPTKCPCLTCMRSVCRRDDACLRYQTRAVTPRLQFRRVVSRDLDAGLEERDEQACHLFFIPTGDTACPA